MSGRDGDFLLLFGTETGQAKAIAEIIRDRALERGLHPQLFCFSHYDSQFYLTKIRVLVTVVSTTGDGEPPFNIRKAWRKLRGKSLTSDYLKRCNFALLGLGDTNYDNFCNMGKMLNKRLLELGATSFYPPGFADDAVGLELVVEPWIDGLWAALDKVFQSLTDTTPPGGTTPPHGEVTHPQTLTPSLDSKVEQLTLSNGCIAKATSSNQSDASNGSVQPSSCVSLCDELQRTNLVRSAPLTLPSPPKPHLTLSLDPPQLHSAVAGSGDFPFHKVPYRLGSTVSIATIVKACPLTKEGSVKRTLEMTLRVKDDISYEPGDAVGFVCPSHSPEVEWLIHRLALSSKAQHSITLSLLPSTTKKKPTLPHHVPTPCTVGDLFTHCLDTRAVPKKAFLRLLATHCSDGGEQRRLEELSSRQGAAQYTKLFTEFRTDILDILNTFPSCLPPLEALIENLPRLQPRYYSVTSSPLVDPHTLTIAFNIEALPPRWWGHQTLGSERHGLATGWFAHVADTCLPTIPTQVPVFTRSQNPFHLPSDSERPVIMIAPGTGVAPFLGFLRHMAQQKVGGVKCRKAWLFFGCRHPEFDYLYKEELERYHSTGLLTRLTVIFSRFPNEGGGACYVQDRVCEEWRDVGRWIVEEQAAVYMCGDAQTVVKQIEKALNEALSKYLSQSPTGSRSAESADDPVSRLKEEGQLFVDLWT